jgi:hypothetical protein
MVRMGASEKQMLNVLADADGLAAADVVRLLVRREYERRFGSGPSKQKKKH